MLHEFVSSNRDELVRRCRSKVSERDSPPATPAGLDHGVPLVLEQLVWALRCEEESPASQRGRNHGLPARRRPRSRSAAPRPCMARSCASRDTPPGRWSRTTRISARPITELATERHAPVTVEEFHTLNRFLDSAIADAVASYGGLTKSRELFARP